MRKIKRLIRFLEKQSNFARDLCLVLLLARVLFLENNQLMFLVELVGSLITLALTGPYNPIDDINE